MKGLWIDIFMGTFRFPISKRRKEPASRKGEKTMKRFLTGLVLLQVAGVGGSYAWQWAQENAMQTYSDTPRFLVGFLILPLLLAVCAALMWAGNRPKFPADGLGMIIGAAICTIGVGIWLGMTGVYMMAGFAYAPVLFWLDAAALVTSVIQTVTVTRR